MSVPVVRSLGDIYPDDAVAEQTARWQHLLAAFAARFGRPPAFVARSPGRVNVIGEHIDYSLYSVLPMAIVADCLVAVAVLPAEGDTYTVDIANVRDDAFPARSVVLPRAGAVPIDARVHEWTNYFKSGLRGALEALRAKPGFQGPVSLQVLLDGTVPVGGGLSSSAAFTSASALAVLAAHDKNPVDKTALTELAIVSERHVGVNSGGMDQAASVFAERGAALLIDFAPALAAAPVRFPPLAPPVCFVVAQSFVAADKFVTGPVHYNLRVVECALAAAYLYAALAGPDAAPLPTDASPLGISLRSVQDWYVRTVDPTASPDTALDTLLHRVDTTLTRTDGYTREAVAAALGISVDDLHARYTTAFPVRADRFLLRQRALHVLGEARRVRQFVALLRGTGPDPCTPAALGALLDASQASCRDLYDCSCPELDQLCAIARRAGAVGSRLTGAGWGGCTVHLVPVEAVAAVRAAWDAEYYDRRQPPLTAAQRAAAVVVSQPGSGSAVYELVGGRLE